MSLTIRDNLEQVPRTYVRVYKHKTYTETGDEERRTYEGHWDVMVPRADAAVGEGGDAYNITATLTRKEGDMATLEIRKAKIKDPKEDEEEAPDTPGSEGNPGESRENPQYTLRLQRAAEPLLTHDRYAGIPKDPLEALRALINGAQRATEMEILELKDDGRLSKKKISIERILKNADNKLANEARNKIEHGTDSFLSFEAELEVRYRVKSLKDFEWREMAKIAYPSGPFPHPPGKRNWLFAGQSVEHSGKIIWITESYLLSGKDGWDRDIYGN